MKAGTSNVSKMRPTKVVGEKTLYHCANCSHFLPKEEFYPSRTKLIGIQSLCKPCSNFICTKRMSERRKANRLTKTQTT